MKPGVISIPHGWGHLMDGIKLGIAQQHAGVNTNILTDDLLLDSLSGNAVLNGIEVSLTKDPAKSEDSKQPEGALSTRSLNAHGLNINQLASAVTGIVTRH